MCIWNRAKDCIMPHLKQEDETHTKPSFDAPNAKVQKFGNAIHRDSDIVYL